MNTFSANRIDHEIMKISQFMKLTDDDKKEIETVRIIPPKLGNKDFGKVFVQYKTPKYQVGLST
jgi:hypothetical protein